MLRKRHLLHPRIELSRGKIEARMGRTKRPERFAPVIDEMLAAAEDILHPGVCWEILTISGREPDGVIHLQNPAEGASVTLRIGIRANLLNPALECFAAVTTIGAELGEKIRELDAEGNLLHAYILDMLGTVALDEAHKAFREAVGSYVSLKNWGAGPVMQPGSLEGWPVEDQDSLLKLLPTKSIGVTLNERHVMLPLKSTSCLVGVGPGYEVMRPECLCVDCPRLDCAWRRERGYD